MIAKRLAETYCEEIRAHFWTLTEADFFRIGTWSSLVSPTNNRKTDSMP
jgi:hypothetical protein